MQTRFPLDFDATLRFPAEPRGWEAIEDYLYVPKPTPHVSDWDTNSLAQCQASLRVLGDVLHENAEAHVLVATTLRPEAWRLLFYRGIYPAESLLMPKFHAEQTLRDLCSNRDPFQDPPSEWLGSERAPNEIAEELELTLRYLGAAPSVAAWLVLSIAHRVDLFPAEVLHCAWWDPRWLRPFTDRVLLVS